jgi:t-SNARE complex subunit (syntaxin)
MEIIIQERDEEIQKLHKQFQEINGITKDLANIVAEQQENIGKLFSFIFNMHIVLTASYILICFSFLCR